MRIRFHQLLLLIALGFLGPVPFARAQTAPDGSEITQRSLVASVTAAEPGKPFLVGLHFEIAKGWHTYWRFPGGVGLATDIQWTLPPGWKAGPTRFPIPELLHDAYGGAFYGYEHDVMFVAELTPPPDAGPGAIPITASVKWQVCQETCIPGEATVNLSLPTGPAQPANQELFNQWIAALPKSTPPPPHELKFEFKEKTIVAHLAKLPANSNPELFLLPEGDFKNNFSFTEKLERKTEPDGSFTYIYPMEMTVDPKVKLNAVLVLKTDSGTREGWVISPQDSRAASSTATPSASPAVPFDPFANLPVEQEHGWQATLLLLFQGLVGGLLLNLMPCVLPVISIKIFGFINQAGEAKERIFKLGLAFCAGVFVFFYALGALVLGLNATGERLGWGSQFQNVYALTILISLIFVFGLSLLGVFEVTLTGGASSRLSELSSKEGLGGAFLHGFFTTLLGTSCTAPFLAPVLGSALNQPGVRVFVLFSSVALGLSLPYFLLSWKPGWVRFIPKPGAWMTRFKQLMGFVQFALIVWLFNSLAARGSDTVISVLAFLLVLSFGCWLLGSYHERRWRVPAAAAITVAGWFVFIQGKLDGKSETRALASNQHGLSWEPYSTDRLGALLREGRPVFIDFTADWCANCKWFEGTAINTDAAIKAFKSKKVALLKADFTDKDPVISQVLAKFGRAGVPLYVLYSDPAQAPWVSDSLTQGSLLEQLGRL